MNPPSLAEYQVIRERKVIGSFSAEELTAGVQQGSLFITDHYTLGGWPMPRSLAEIFPLQTRVQRRAGKLKLRTPVLVFVMLCGLAAASLGIYALRRTDGPVPAAAPSSQGLR